MHMQPGRAAGYGALAAAAVVALTTVQPLAAQTTDDDWLRRCRDDATDSYWNGERTERACEVRVERLRPRGRLAVDGRENGGVVVNGVDGEVAVVHARITAQAPTAAEAAAIARGVRIATAADSVYATGPERERGRSWYVSYVIEAPRRVDLRVFTHNGSVKVSDVAGRMELSAHNGSMSLAGLGGDVRARTRNGSLDVRLAGRRWEGAGLDAETRNGAVRLEIPEGYAARLEAGTVNGRFSTDIPLTVQGRVGRTITTDIGGGGPPIRAATTNGTVRITKGGGGL